MNRQRLILFILLVILAVAVAWSYFFWPRPKVATSLKYLPGQRASSVRESGVTGAAPALPRDPRILNLDLLNREQSVFKGYRRNIFRPVFMDEVKIMKQKAAAIKPVPLPPSPAVVPPPPPPPVDQAEEMKKSRRRELAKFVFKGFVSKGNMKTIFLSKGDTILLVKKGDTFEQFYKAAAITDQALTILVTDTNDEIVIPLVENLNLKTLP